MTESKQTTVPTLTQEQLDRILAGNTGTGAISAPQGTENVVIKNDKFDPSKPISAPGGDNYPIISVPSPNATPKPTTSQPTAYGSAENNRLSSLKPRPLTRNV